MISKELLSEVINIKIEDIIDLKMFGKDLKYYEKCLLKSCCDGRLSNHKDSICKSITIYELAFKCKEWAILNHYDFTILIDTIVIYNEGIQIYTIYNTLEDDNFIPFDPDYEIKACQWILDNKSGSSE